MSAFQYTLPDVHKSWIQCLVSDSILIFRTFMSGHYAETAIFVESNCITSSGFRRNSNYGFECLKHLFFAAPIYFSHCSGPMFIQCKSGNPIHTVQISTWEIDKNKPMSVIEKRSSFGMSLTCPHSFSRQPQNPPRSF